ncbi:MAG: glutamate-5-semialdehyde dehydrogenase [Rhodospirillales bacterium]|nr:glutamate-5-semialdehyde dehydrogenase [Rhodospirillales bacterium]MDH3909982.1 glutamate-5-semialdehyde dehydrogenase [Rhodospirillales bacterium]MDH3917720.1 glutamate-5-semialdehyde dehydrogenase [Rhodospirillales bacterium]MDH3969142.1 glutamate-5-semialdehyde dehydrogenase [Rhodospirillales bacterium]
MADLGRAARSAAHELALAAPEAKSRALKAAAQAIRQSRDKILEANGRDVEAARAKGLSAALLDRLELDAGRSEAMAAGLEAIAEFPDPVGRVMAEWDRPNGLKIARVSVPLGVIGIIYESRPNVTADAGGLCLKAGNAAILRGGSESFHSSGAILDCLRQGLAEAGLPEAAIQRVPTTDRTAVGLLLTMNDYVDVIVPRGGRGLIERVFAESRIPVLAHLEGICHTYIDRSADLEMAREIVVNAKMRRTGICGATETLLVDRPVVKSHLPAILNALIAAGCAVRGGADTRALDERVTPASEEDWVTEYLAPVISVKVLDGVDEAIGHINRYGSHHTEAIVAEDAAAAERFLARVDSGIVMHNASTQFADGGEFGMGAEIGISTGKLHARGPVGAEQLTSIKYVVRGQGQVRP